MLYQFLVEQQDKSVAPTRLAGVLESLRFCQHVLDIPELANLTSSRRCSGAAATKRGGVRRQASPFTVIELQVLHKMVCSIDENLWDRIFCGTVLMMVYTRSRWSDLQRAESMIIDRDGSGVLRFLECIVSSHKCVHSAAFRNAFLHAVAPCQGITEDYWAESWLSCRANMNLELGRLPLLPAPNTSGAPTKRPLSSEETPSPKIRSSHGGWVSSSRNSWLQSSGFSTLVVSVCGVWLGWRYRIPWKITPRKIIMEPENTPLEKENHLPNHHFQVLC